MKTVVLPLLAACLLVALTACSAVEPSHPSNPLLRLSTTTSVSDSGLLPELEKVFEDTTGYRLDILANGSGAAITLGESGDADILFVHSRSAEEAFVADGFGIERIPLMYNFFMIAGPEEDPAGVMDASSAAEAFQRISDAKAFFLSRGDDSGTHKAELNLWKAAAITPTGDWYVSAGKGMGPSLIMAGEMGAYLLTDKATWLATRSQTGLMSVLDGTDDMKNPYSLIAVDPAKNPGVNADGAQAFIDFMAGDLARAIIRTFGVAKYGEPLFFLE